MTRLLSSRTGGLLVMAAIIAVLPLVLPNKFYFNVAILVGLNAVVCIGLNLVMGYAGQISLGHAGFFGLGAYLSAILSAKFGWPPLAGIAASVIGVSLLAFAVARPILRLQGHYLAMATLGLGIIISLVISKETWLTGGPDGMSVPSLKIAGTRIQGELWWYWITGGLLLLSVWISLNLIDSGIGRALRAVSTSEVGTEASGVDIVRYKTAVFVVSAAFAAVAGSATAYYTNFITPIEAEFIRSIEFVTMVVIGGLASTYGAVIGAAILTVLPQVLTRLHDYDQIVLGGLLVAIMILMPEGLAPTLMRSFRRLWK